MTWNPVHAQRFKLGIGLPEEAFAQQLGNRRCRRNDRQRRDDQPARRDERTVGAAAPYMP